MSRYYEPIKERTFIIILQILKVSKFQQSEQCEKRLLKYVNIPVLEYFANLAIISECTPIIFIFSFLWRKFKTDRIKIIHPNHPNGYAVDGDRRFSAGEISNFSLQSTSLYDI